MESIKNITICFVAGRSGGHIKPALTLAEHAKLDKNARIIFISTTKKLELEIIQSASIVDVHMALTLKNIPKHFWWYPWYFLTLLYATMKSLLFLYKEKPTTIISMGGYVSLPVCIAARLLKIPVELHELNAIPGKATKFLAPLSTTIHVNFKKALSSFSLKKSKLVHYPLQFDKSAKIAQMDALQTLNLLSNKKTLLILGGSQGSLFINNLMKTVCLNETLKNKIQLIHQTGSNDTFNWKTFYTEHAIPAHVFTFSENMQLYYSAADIIICRAGAGTLFEATFFQKPCIVIPLETKTTSHQCDNAYAMAEEHPDLVKVIRQKQLHQNPELILELVNG